MFILHGCFVDQWVFLLCSPLNIAHVGAEPVDSILKITSLRVRSCSVPASQPWVFAYTRFRSSAAAVLLPVYQSPVLIISTSSFLLCLLKEGVMLG